MVKSIIKPHFPRLRTPILAIAFVLLAARPGHALDPQRHLTQYFHRIWQVQQGLPRAQIFSIRQTRDGYLWLGTQTGLVRFDGVRFSVIRQNSGASLENLWIEDIVEDAEHNLWLATDGAGLIRFAGGVAKQYLCADGLPSDSLRCLLIDRKGDLWIGTDAGLAQLSHGKITSQQPSDGRAATRILAVAEAKDGTIYAGGDGPDLIAIKGGQPARGRLGSLRENSAIRALLPDDDGTLWIGTSEGLVHLDGDSARCFTTADGLADDSVYALVRGRHGLIWIGTKEGFSRMKNGEFESFRKRDGLSQSTAFALCEDREGSFWVGTKNGLNQFCDRRVIPFTTSEGLPSNDMGPVSQDGSGGTWIGTLDAGLAHYDGRRFEVLTEEQGLASNTVTALAGGEAGELWIGGPRGLNHMQQRRVDRLYTTEQGLPSSSIQCLCRDRHGVLWVGASAGLAEFREGRFIARAGGAEIPSSILALADFRGQFLLVATQGGKLWRYAQEKWSAVDGEGLPQTEIGALLEDKDGLIWIGTRGSGLRLFDGEKTSSFRTKNGLFDEDIFGIVADDADRLWMACSQGIFYVSRSDLHSFAAGKIKSFESTPFAPTEAFRTIECQDGVQPAACKMSDGKIWFSTIRGLIVVDPARLQRKLPPTPVSVEEVIVNGKKELPRKSMTLAPGQSNVSFRWAALSFIAPSRIVFRYQLAGFDEGWIEAGDRREAFYTNLPPGNFQFRVAAKNVDGNYYEAPTIGLTLEPYIYQRRWFWPLCIAALTGAGLIALRLRVRRVKDQLRAVVAERSRIARELHDTLMQGFSGITMEMQALSTRLPQSPERRTLEEIISDAAVCLREARRSVAGLRSARDESSGLAAAIAQAARHLTETQDFRLKLQLGRCPMSLPPEVQYNLLRIVQEAISNAIKHSGGSTVEVSLDCTVGQLRLSVKDDGVGFDALEKTAAHPGHYGLLGMRERASQIGAELTFESEPGRGAIVRVVLPTTSTADDATLAADAPLAADASASGER